MTSCGCREHQGRTPLREPGGRDRLNFGQEIHPVLNWGF